MLERCALNPALHQSRNGAESTKFPKYIEREQRTGEPWLTRDLLEKAKLLKTYKRCTKAISSFDDKHSLPTNEQATTEESLSTLRTWCESVRAKMVLVRRAQSARAEHHAQFYAGGDANHCLFLDVLQNESNTLEHLAQVLEERAYEIMMKQREADWILSASEETFICDETPPLVTPPSTPPRSPTNSALSTAKNRGKKKRTTPRNAPAAVVRPLTPPLEDSFEQQFWAENDKITHSQCPSILLNRLKAYLNAPESLPSSVRPSLWHSVVSQLFRIVILRSPDLAPLALTVPDVHINPIESFLDLLSDCENNYEHRKSCRISKLWRRMKFAKATDIKTSKGKVMGLLGVQILRDAIADVCRHGCANDSVRKKERIWILGGWVYKMSSEADLSPEGWDLLYQFATKTTKKKTVFIEEWERPWVYVKMLRDEPSTMTILDHLASSDKLVVLAQKSGDDKVSHQPQMCLPTRLACSCCRNKSELWLSRVRSGMSPSERKSAHWTVSSFFPMDKALLSFASTSSETRHGHRYTDCYDVLIMDNMPLAHSNTTSCGALSSQAMWQTFLGNLGAEILQAKGLSTVLELYEEARTQAIASGEPVPPLANHVTGRYDEDHRASPTEYLIAREMFREDVQ
ncbi:hypothetical protein OIV83_003486 [Microbotryomycetes sp. JL201]|nr:hypothetical protein OIV83_003486 [Microbotryomycetes sp. JL201]